MNIGILFVYLASGIFTAAIVAGLFKMVDLLFYVFCLGFGMVDNYLQNKYWQKKSEENNSVHSYKIMREYDNAA
jgi:hypothetical protein